MLFQDRHATAHAVRAWHHSPDNTIRLANAKDKAVKDYLLDWDQKTKATYQQ